MQVTIREVAKAANVSIGTVSRALNGSSSVSPESAQRVQAAVLSMNYRPLRSRNRHDSDRPLGDKRIALVVLGMDRTLESLPIFASAFHGIEAAASKAGAVLMVADIPHLSELPPILKREKLDGLLLKGAQEGDLLKAMSQELRDRMSSLPSVWFLGRPEESWGDVVNSHDLLVGKLAAEYLLSRGHRRLAYLNPKTGHRVFKTRELSFLWHAQSAGATVRSFVKTEHQAIRYPLLPVQGTQSVQDLVDALLAEQPRPTAVFCPADSVAALVYRALATRGLAVARDLSIISCNWERPLINGLLPTLTTIDVHAEAIGQRAVEQLTARLTERDSGPAVEISISPTLIAGESVATIPS